tara:strand:- start:304 stop:633 length:330 start_codon:yes stop_codon:yes gene_type:complete
MPYLKADCFNLIKEYAGIYSISTNWKYMNKISQVKLYEFYKSTFNCPITNVFKTAPNNKHYILKCAIKVNLKHLHFNVIDRTWNHRAVMTKNNWITLNELIIKNMPKNN